MNETPEPKAASRLLLLTQPSDHLSRALSAGALGEAARIDPAIGQRMDINEAICLLLLEDENFLVKGAAARALGLLQSQAALNCLDDYIARGPRQPPQPAICAEQPLAADCLQYQAALAAVGVQATRAATRIAGQNHSVANPGDMGQARAAYLRQLQRYLEMLSQ